MLERVGPYGRRMGAVLLVLAGASAAGASPSKVPSTPDQTSASAPAAAAVRPYAMRGVELGISLDEFRALAVPQDNLSSYDLHIRCTDQFPAGGLGPGPGLGSLWRYPVNEPGVVNCGWFHRTSPTWVSELFVTLGGGKGPPQFQFVEQDGKQRLFRISVKANTEYYPGIPGALSRVYGEPAKTVEPFQVQSGATFPATTLTWRNAVSTISIVDHCEHLERYCLTYEHTEFKNVYDALIERRDAAAASKI